MEQQYISQYKPPLNIYSESLQISKPVTYKEHLKVLVKKVAEKYGAVGEAFRRNDIPKGHFYNVINPNRQTTSGNPFYTPIEWLVKLTRDAQDYFMLKRIAKDCGCILITPIDIKELKTTDPSAALDVIQRVLGTIK
jgi:hypothetical protein